MEDEDEPREDMDDFENPDVTIEYLQKGKRNKKEKERI